MDKIFNGIKSKSQDKFWGAFNALIKWIEVNNLEDEFNSYCNEFQDEKHVYSSQELAGLMYWFRHGTEKKLKEAIHA